MKRIIYILILFGLSIHSQNKTLEYNQWTNKEFLKTISNNELIGGFILSTGDTVKVGQIVKFGTPKHNRPVYTPLLNAKKNYFTTIYIGKPKINTISRLLYFPSDFYLNKKVKIETIIAKKFGKKKPGVILLGLKLSDENLPQIDITGLTFSFEYNELQVIGGVLTKESAIRKLKEAKEKLDLQLITQKEYDEIKSKLAPIIMKE